MQELKQAFARWYNARHERRGYLWGDRFKGVLVSKAGDAEVVCAAYIDLNPIRAEMVTRPEAYRWSSMGLRVRNPKRAKRLLTGLRHPELRRHGQAWYRRFVYLAGALPAKGKRGTLSRAVADAVDARCGRLGITDRLRYRCLNLSEGAAIGTADFITDLQREWGRTFARARAFLAPSVAESSGNTGAGASVGKDDDRLFATRALRQRGSVPAGAPPAARG